MQDTRRAVRAFYEQIGQRELSYKDHLNEAAAECCAPTCCADGEASAQADLSVEALSAMIGYGEELESVPDGANLGLGCGNPTALADLKPGEVVLDLGSGGGLDCLLAAQKVGDTGEVIGVDMTPAMIDRARDNASTYSNVSFRLGEIEHLPVKDDHVDVLMSNCVINLSTEKQQVFNESFRVLKPGGRLAISDIVALQPLPDAILKDIQAYVACVGGASTIEETIEMLHQAGFEHVSVTPKPNAQAVIEQCLPESNIGAFITSASITATKP